jgi:isocitrate lyase
MLDGDWSSDVCSSDLFVSHQQEVGTGYFDEVTTVIQGGSSSVKALTGSTEEEQFH